jgi:hypothetical protein
LKARIRAAAILIALIADASYGNAMDLFAGYSALPVRGDLVHGATVAASWPRGRRALRIAVDASGHSGLSSGESLREFGVLAGGGFAPWPNARLSPFMSLKGGVVRARRQIKVFGVGIGAQGVCDDGCYDTGPAAEFGGGLDLRLGGRWGLRLAQADYRIHRVAGGTERGVRLSAGLVRH